MNIVERPFVTVAYIVETTSSLLLVLVGIYFIVAVRIVERYLIVVAHIVETDFIFLGPSILSRKTPRKIYISVEVRS